MTGKEKLLVIVLSIITVYIVFFCSNPSFSASPEHSEGKPVAVDIVKEHVFRQYLRGVSTLETTRKSLISPEIAGRVEKVFVDIGRRVEKGQVLARLDQARYALMVERAQAALATASAAEKQARAVFNHAGKDYVRSKSLMDRGVIPEKAFDEAEAGYKKAREALNASGKDVERLRVMLKAAQLDLTDTEIRSPIDGVVVVRNVEEGQAISPGMVIFKIVDNSLLHADLQAPEHELRRLKLNAPAEIGTDSWPDDVFEGTVSVINPMVDPHTRNICIRVVIPNKDEKLVEGMYARITLHLGDSRKAAVDRDALRKMPGSGSYYVFVVRNGRAEKKFVSIGAKDDRLAEIEDGLSLGEIVVISGADRLKSGDAVYLASASRLVN